MKITDELKRTIFEGAFYLIFIVLPISLGYFGGLALEGFSSSFSSNIIKINDYLGTFTIYQGMLFVSAFVLIFLVVNHLFIKKGEFPSTQKGVGWGRIFSVSFIWNPEQGMIGVVSPKTAKWMNNILRMTLLSIILFGIFGVLLVANPGVSGSAIPVTSQQVTPASDIIFGALIPASAENGNLMLSLLLLSGLNALFCFWIYKRTGDRKLALLLYFIISLVVVCSLMGLLWAGYHKIVYGNDDVSLFRTFVFGYLGSAITIITGIFIIWYFWHFFNNGVLKALQIWSPDIVLIWLIVITALAIISLTIYEIYLLRRRRAGKVEGLLE